MPAKTFQELAARAVAEGLDPATPAVAMASATRPEEKVVAASIGDLAQRLAQERLSGPLLIMVGRCFARVTGMHATSSRHPAESRSVSGLGRTGDMTARCWKRS
jgi:siroheme synthase